MQVNLEITDQADIDALEWARVQHNENPETDENGDPIVIPDGDAYIRFVARRALDSYRVQKAQADKLAALES